MHSFSKILFLLVGIGHLVLGIYTAVHLNEEQKAASPIKAALAQYGEKGYTESNSQVKGVFMPFFVALFCLVVAVIPYNGVLYFLIILCLLEMGGFIWEMLAVNAINEQQTAWYQMVLKVAEGFGKSQIFKDAENGHRKKRFWASLIQIVTRIIPYIEKITPYLAKIDVVLSTLEPVMDTLKGFFGTKEKVENVVHKIHDEPDILNFYLRLAKALEKSQLLSEIGLGASIVTLVFVLGMTLFYTWEYKKKQSAMTFPPCEPLPPKCATTTTRHHKKPSSSNYETTISHI
ncbi:unnamed protein product [Caenorhabditis angaria]|uniref:Uncharacterized protein n=1 Tax=Caenorhabditis angaria TaxID=860376 RepID=A0A9P1IP61_9PELO|nr:unnamed protein product [Caenorhabditis angaria]